MPRLEQADGRREQFEPGLEVLARSLEVALDAVRDPAEPDGLILIARRSGKANRAHRQREVVGMPLAHVEVGREAAEHRIPAGRRREKDLVDPELGLHSAVAVRAEGRREQLRAKAHTEIRDAGEHRLANRLLLGRDPGMLVVVPHVHARAHDDEEVVLAPVGDRLTLVEHDPVDRDPAPVQHIAVDADRIGTQVFERECPHGASPVSRGNHTPATEPIQTGHAENR